MGFPETETRISSPQDLVLRQAKRCLADGTLRLIRPADVPFPIADLGEVPDEGPWPDYLEAHFEDSRGNRFRLTVETYHGAGGAWERV